MYEVELGARLPRVPPVPPAGGTVAQARLLLRLHTRPISEVVLPLTPDGLEPEELADALADIVRLADAHLECDGLPTPPRLTASGLGGDGVPRCLHRRHELEADGPWMTVLIATRDRPESLRRCLDSIARMCYRRFDVVVVDSAPSSDATARAVEAWQRDHPFPTVSYLRERRPGVALAHNRGLAAATGSWVAITDDDVVVDRYWLSGIAEAATSDPGVGCVTGLILPAEIDTTAQVLLEQFGGYGRGYQRRSVDLNGHRPDDRLFPFTVGRLGSGANMAFETALLRERGGFDPAMGTGTTARGGDDLLALLRVITGGRTLVYEPTALVWHWHRRDYGSLRRLVHDYGVGLGAYLTSAVVHEPRLLPGMLRRLVLGAWHVVGRSSEKNRNKRPDYPRELEIIELIGLARGPLAYAVSRWRHRRMSR
ncbi:glycosyltransferase [Pseudonocardia hispaniensis]|uniref:Glycosyltransferase n=1 Tax=Pseudonocardia hispaniensis TaxID=904933 RepID=A0ABW1IZ95_9PSEU